MKRLLIFLPAFFLAIINCFSQQLTAKQKQQLAKNDAESFRLNDADLEKFRYDRDMVRFAEAHNPDIKAILLPQRFRFRFTKADYYSAWFKPTKFSTRDTALLSDSVYVQAYRKKAYDKTASRHTAGHYIAIYGGIAGGLLLIGGIYIALITAWN